jgi:parallel beta-helix repeat protein
MLKGGHGMGMKVNIIIIFLAVIIGSVGCSRQISRNKEGNAIHVDNIGAKPDVIYVDDYGAKPDEPAFDSGPAIRNALSKAKDLGYNIKVKFSKGIYYVAPETSGKEYVNSNFCFSVIKAEGLTLEGNKTEIRFLDTFSGGFAFSASKNIRVEGLTFDYQIPPFIQGTVTSVNPAAYSIEFTPDQGFPVIDDPKFMKAPIVYATVHDPENRLFTKSTKSAEMFVLSAISKTSNEKYRLQLTKHPTYKNVLGEGNDIEPGDTLVITNRRSSHIPLHFSGCSAVIIRDVIIYSSPQIGIGLNGMEDKTLVDNLKVMIRPSSGRLISTNGDAIHCTNNRVGPTIENSYFEAIKDDVIAIKSVTYAITGVLSENEIVTGKLLGNIRTGDRIAIFDPVSGTIKGNAGVKEIIKNADSTRFILDKSIPGITSGTDHKNSDMIFTLSTNGDNFIIRNNEIIRSRHYGIVVRSSNGIIENNRIYDTGADGIVVVNAPEWPEGALSENIIIRNNKISNAAYNGYWSNINDNEAIKVKGEKLGRLVTDGRMQKNITIENNEILQSSKFGIYIGGVDGINLSNNIIKNISVEKTLSGNNGSIMIENSGNVRIAGLKIEDMRKDLTGIICVDTRTDEFLPIDLNLSIDKSVQIIKNLDTK